MNRLDAQQLKPKTLPNEARMTMKQRAEMLDGRSVAADIKDEVRAGLTMLRERYDVHPRLVVVRVGNDPASAVYVRNKIRTSGCSPPS